MTSNLRADLYVAPMIPISTPEPLPFGIPATWSHMASTLIHGDKEALLVDPPLTRQQGEELAAWIKEVIPNKTLTTVFITHGHGDHYFAVGSILRHFPSAKVFGTPHTIEHMKEQEGTYWFDEIWTTWFPNQLEKPAPGTIQPLPADNIIELEGHKLRVVEAGHSDTKDTSFLYVPSLSMVVAGDICYNELHQWLVEATTEEKRQGWIAALRKIEELKPATVIASHKRPGAVDGINNVASTIEYIETFGKLKGQSGSAEELYHKMMQKYSSRINPVILWEGCKANF